MTAGLSKERGIISKTAGMKEDSANSILVSSLASAAIVKAEI
jgi:hypothetical protein